MISIDLVVFYFIGVFNEELVYYKKKYEQRKAITPHSYKKNVFGLDLFR